MSLNKPAGCHGCPMFGDGLGFVPDKFVESAKVCVLGQNPGETEEMVGEPFVGKTGEMLKQEFFPRANLQAETTSLGNAIKCRWIKGGKKVNELPPAAILNPALEHCVKAHLRIPSNIKLVIACGALAWKAMDGEGSIGDWRGFLKT